MCILRETFDNKMKLILLKRCFLFLACLIHKIEFIESSNLKSLETLGFLPMTGKGWTGGQACLPGILMALRHVNERSGLLDGYNLTYTWVDSQCNAGVAAFKMFEHLQKPPTKVMLLGCGCSIESEATAQISHLFNLTQLSYGSTSPILSDRNRFPNFFRLVVPDQMLNPAKIALLKLFNWKKVATINQALEFFSVVIDDFVHRVERTGISVISQEIFEQDPLTRVENLKRRDARIIVTACYEDKARLLLCHAYRVGLYGPKIVWIFYGWYSLQFWRINLHNVPCSEEEMELAADGAFVIGYYVMNPILQRGIANLTVPEFEILVKQEETYEPWHDMYIINGQCYDHIWVAALALNCTDAYLKANGFSKSLDEFTYKDSDINEIIMSCLYNVSMVGIIGSIAFGQGADPIRNVKIERIQGRHRENIGTYIMEEEPRHFQWTGEILWQNGDIPRDSTYVTYEELTIPVSLYVIIAVLAGFGVLTAVMFFVFNIVHRNNRVVKLSSPNINNVLLLGCVLTYCTLFMKPIESVTPNVCQARTYCFALGFTIAFGALFSKTWRVYKIFTNKKLLKVTIKDYQLIGIVCTMIGIIVGIMVVWDIVGPHRVIRKELVNEVHHTGNDAEIHWFVHVCYSEYSMYFGWTLYVTEGALLTFSAFLAWESRYVKIAALNDSRQIGMCIYNVVVLSAVGLTLTLLMEDHIVRLYGVTSGCILIGTTATQLIVFLPKVIAVYRHNTVEAVSIPAPKCSISTLVTRPTYLSLEEP